MPRREFATHKELQDYAALTGKVSLSEAISARQRQLSPDNTRSCYWNRVRSIVLRERPEALARPALRICAGLPRT
jgi:hypothetical protein